LTPLDYDTFFTFVGEGSYESFVSHLDAALQENCEWKVLAEEEDVSSDVTIRVKVRGDLYTAYVNGQRWLSVTDATFQKGRVGLGLYCDSGSI